MHLKRYNDALNVIKDAENIYTNSAELLFLKGEIYFLRGQLEDAKQMFHLIVDNQDKYNHIILRPDLKDQKPHIRLGEIYLYQEDYSNAIFHYSSVLNINKYDNESIRKVIYILNKFHSKEEISHFLYSKELVNSKNVNSYVKACFDVGNPDLALSLLENFYEDKKLLYKVGLLKKTCMKEEGNLEEFHDILEYPVMKELIKSNWINIIDLFLLRKFANQDNKISRLMMYFEKETTLKTLIHIFQNEPVEESIEEGLFILSLQTLINYKELSLCEILLNNIQYLDRKSISKVAILLFSNSFKIEALQLYEKADWSYLEAEDFLNIINSLLQTNSITHAMKMANYAISIYNQDFRFYKLILENTQDDKVFSQTLQNAREVFLDSSFLGQIK